MKEYRTRKVVGNACLEAQRVKSQQGMLLVAVCKDPLILLRHRRDESADLHRFQKMEVHSSNCDSTSPLEG